MARTDAQGFLAQGRREGLKEGRIEAQRELLLERKFGSLSDLVKSRIAACTEAQLMDLALRLVEARSLEELTL